MKKLFLTTTILTLTLPVIDAMAQTDYMASGRKSYDPDKPRFLQNRPVTPAPVVTPTETVVAREPSLMPMPSVDNDAVVALPTPNDDTATLWGAKWSGSINAGAELETGNSDSQSFALDAESRLNWDDVHRWTLGADYENEEENDVEVSDEYEFYTAYDYFFADKWFWNNAASYEVDNIESLDSRITATSGLGYQFYDEDDLNLEVTFGPGYEREEYTNQDAQSNMTANWTLDYEQGFYDDTVRLFHNHDWASPTDDFSSWLFESASGVKVPLKAGIVATGEIDFDYNNDPAIGEGEDDTTYRLKLGYEWP